MKQRTQINMEGVFISSTELVQRLISTFCNAGLPKPEIFPNELTPVASYLWKF